MDPGDDGGNRQAATEYVYVSIYRHASGGRDDGREKEETMIPITLTDAAKARIAELARRHEGASGLILRIAKGKGCGGNEYKMDYADGVPAGHDRLDVADGLALYIPMTDSFMMFGMTIDFGTDDMGNAKFLFENPNETGRCGCGESFSIDPAKPHGH
jgi:iron-sulfur cluster assembly accessory protein